MDTILKQKIANPSMELYCPHRRTLSPTSKLIEAIIDLITAEDYSKQVCRGAFLINVDGEILLILFTKHLPSRRLKAVSNKLKKLLLMTHCMTKVLNFGSQIKKAKSLLMIILNEYIENPDPRENF